MRRTVFTVGILGGLVAGFSARAEAFTATSFRIAASSAPVIVLGRIDKGREGTRVIDVAQVIRGTAAPTISFNPRIAGFYRELRIGSTYLILLTSELKPLGPYAFCGTVNSLQIIDGLVAAPEDLDSNLNSKKILTLSEVEKIIRLEEK